MQTKIFLLLVILNGFFNSNVNGQIIETYFSDAENKEGGKVNDYIKGDDYIIIGGKSFDNYPGQPSVTKIDTLGNVIWSTTNNDTATYSYSDIYVYKVFISGGYVYALIIMNAWPDDPKEVWKIDASNGNILWKKEFYSGHFRLPKHFIDYDSSKFLIGYYESSGNPKYAFLNKMDGDTISTHVIGNGSNLSFGLATDSDLNIYYTYKDSIFKANGMDPDSIFWRNALPSSSDIVDFLNIHIDPNDSIYLFARYDDLSSSDGRGKVISLNSSNGNFLWEANAPGGEIANVYFVEKGGYIYSTWRHAFVGGGSYNFWTSKIDKTLGNVVWNSSHSFSSIGTSDSHSGSGEGAMSIDVDDNGDVFLTGYYGDANYGPENWGILKLNGITGNNVYELTITEDSTKFDNLSVGMAACVINNKPYFVGELQTYHPNYNERSKTTFIKLDGNSGNISIKKHIGGEYQFPSRTIQIENYRTNKTIALKQIGRYTNIELYDFNKNLVWDKSFQRNFMLFGSDLVVDNDHGNIYFSAYSVDEISSTPYFSPQTDSIYVFKIDSSGNLKNEYSFYVGVNGATPVEIIHDGINTFVFYQISNTIYYRKINGNGLSLEHNLNVNYIDLLSQTRCAIDYSDSTILVFGYKNYANRVIELNKNTLNSVDLATIPVIQKINYVEKNGSNNVILCGQNNMNSDILMSYNTSLLDTLWTESYSSQAEIVKFTFNEDSTFIYSIGIQSADIILRKNEALNGLESWSYSYNGPSNLTERPLDIAFDKNRNQLVYTGYQSDTSGVNVNKSVLIETIDTNGINTNTYIKQGDFNGDNIGTCACVLKDGSVWIGGNLNHSVYGEAGFIYEIDSSLIILSIDEKYSNLGSTEKIAAYPNPFLDFIYIKYRVLKNNSSAILTIHDIEGKTIYTENIQNQQIGEHYLRINTTELHGIYLLKLQLNGQIFNDKIISVR